MKRHGSLWPQIVDFANLLAAARQAQRGKRFRDNVLAFNYNLEGNLLQLREDLTAKTYQPGAYRTFEIVEPKRRLISAAPYRDRVVHHALCNVIVPAIAQLSRLPEPSRDGPLAPAKPIASNALPRYDRRKG